MPRLSNKAIRFRQRGAYGARRRLEARRDARPPEELPAVPATPAAIPLPLPNPATESADLPQPLPRL